MNLINTGSDKYTSLFAANKLNISPKKRNMFVYCFMLKKKGSVGSKFVFIKFIMAMDQMEGHKFCH